MLDLKQKIGFMVLLGLTSTVQANVSYSTLENLAVQNGFLTLNPDNSLSLQAPTGADNQQWAFMVEPGTNHWSLRNKTNPKLCVNSRHTYKSCDTGLLYTTQRNFFPREIERNIFFIHNQYRSHLHLPLQDYLAADENQTGLKYIALNDANVNQLKWRYHGKVSQSHNHFIGTRTVLLFNVYFKGQKPKNGQDVYNAVFKNNKNVLNLQEYFEISSKDKASITGQFWDNFALEVNPLTSCSSQEIQDKIATPLENFIKVKGLKYDHLLVEMPRSPLCGYGAIARLGKVSQGILSNGIGHQYGMWTHEMGHHFGFEHTKSLTTYKVNDQVVKLNAQSKIADFGLDYSDAMGGGGLALFPISYRLSLGWIDESEISEINKIGIYTLLPAYSTKKGAKAFRISHKDGSFLELEYRAKQGVYDINSHITGKGLTVRKVSPRGKKLLNYIVDTTPQTDSKDSPLMLGQTLIDEFSGYSITVMSIDEHKGAQLRISR